MGQLRAIVAFASRLLFSLLFSLFVNSFGSFNATYGSLAGVAVFAPKRKKPNTSLTFRPLQLGSRRGLL